MADFVALDGSGHRLWAVTDTATARRDRRRAGRHPGADRRRSPPLRGVPPAAGRAARPGSRRTAPHRGTTGWPCSSTRRDHPLHDRPHPPLGRRPDHVGRLGDLRRPRRRVPRLPGPGGGVRRPARRRTRTTGRRRGPRSWSPTAGPGRCCGHRGPARWTRRCCTTSLLPAWGVAEEQVGYHHSLDQALHTTARQPGIVVAVHPPTVPEVMETAARGVRMPRKSTSFAPKPRMGVVMRDLHDA